MNDFCPDDAICLKEPTCMECGRKCSTYAIGSYTNEMYRHLRGETEFCKGYKFKYIQL